MRGRAVVVGVAAVAVAVVAVAVVLAQGGDDGSDGDVVLLPADAVREPSFLGDLGPTGSPVEATGPDPDSFGPAQDPVAGAALGVNGNAEGLYTARRDEALCDLEAAEALLAEPEGAEAEARADAWFTAIDRHVDGRPAWVRDLTAVQLRHDTRVDGHDLVDGAGERFPAVLQAGTAVLVDRYGVPRLRCADGMPLAAPAPGEVAAADPDDAWDGYNASAVVVVEIGSEVGELLVLDTETGEVFERRLGTNGDGDNDHRVAEAPARCDDCPELDVTMTVTGATEAVLERTRGPEENRRDPEGLHWSPGDAEPGTYAVTVHNTFYLHHVLATDQEYANWHLYDDPALEGEEYQAVPQVPTPGSPPSSQWELQVCVPGEVTLTVEVDRVVTDTVTQHLTCDEAGRDWLYEFTVP